MPKGPVRPNLSPEQLKWQKRGKNNTGLAMSGPAIFAGLFVFNAIASLSGITLVTILNYLIFPYIVYTAFMGKFKLLNFLSFQSYTNIPKLKAENQTWLNYFASHLNPRNWDWNTPFNLVNRTLAFQMGVLFLFLVAIAYRDGSELIDEKFADAVKEWYFFPILLAAGGLESLLTNLLGFAGKTGVHIGAYNIIKNMLRYPLLNPKVRAKRALEDQKIEAVFMNFKKRFDQLIKLKKTHPFGHSNLSPTELEKINEEIKEIKKQLTALGLPTTFQPSTGIQQNRDNDIGIPEAVIIDDGDLTQMRRAIENHDQQEFDSTIFRTTVLNTYDKNPGQYPQFLPKPQSWGEFFFTLITGIIASGIIFAGMLNFKDMWKAIASDYGWKSDSAQAWTHWLGFPSMFSMTLMSIITGKANADMLTEWQYDRNPEINILEPEEKRSLFLDAGKICFVGSATNGYQAYKAGTELPVSPNKDIRKYSALGASLAGITLNELPAFYALEKIDATEEAMARNPYLLLGYIVQGFFKAAQNENTEEALPYRPWVNNTVTWFRERKDACFNWVTAHRNQDYTSLT